jgi:hypothetical protein
MGELIPDGYRRLPGGGMELIDPVDCPSGHPFRWGQRGYSPCAKHRGHPKWTCACGRDIYRAEGRFVTTLAC